MFVQLSFIFERCRVRLSACREAPRDGTPNGTIVGWGGVQAPRTGGHRRSGIPHQRGATVISPRGPVTGSEGGRGSGVETPGRRIPKALGDSSWCSKQPQRSTCGRTRGAGSGGRGEGSTLGGSTTGLDCSPRLDAGSAGLGAGALRESTPAAFCDCVAVGLY